jgi:Glutamate synthase domain 1
MQQRKKEMHNYRIGILGLSSGAPGPGASSSIKRANIIKQQLEPSRGAYSTLSPNPSGLYLPEHEHDACGLGIVVDLKKKSSHSVISDALTILQNLEHRGAVGGDKKLAMAQAFCARSPTAFSAAKWQSTICHTESACSFAGLPQRLCQREEACFQYRRRARFWPYILARCTYPSPSARRTRQQDNAAHQPSCFCSIESARHCRE